MCEREVARARGCGLLAAYFAWLVVLIVAAVDGWVLTYLLWTCVVVVGSGVVFLTLPALRRAR